MIKICSKSIGRPLQLIFNQCIDNGSSTLEWKKANIIPIHKNDDKQYLKYYQTVPLLSICGKILINT